MDWQEILTKILTGLVVGFVVVAGVKMMTLKSTRSSGQDSSDRNPDDRS